MSDTRIECKVCWQDWLVPYRNVLDGARCLLCPECDSVCLPGDDLSKPSGNSLSTVFDGHQFLPGEVDWDFIEPVKGAGN